MRRNYVGPNYFGGSNVSWLGVSHSSKLRNHNLRCQKLFSKELLFCNHFFDYSATKKPVLYLCAEAMPIR